MESSIEKEIIVLNKYIEDFKNIENLKQYKIEELILFLENEIIDENLDVCGLVRSWISILKKIELKMELTEFEEMAVGRAKFGRFNLIKELREDDSKNKKILRFINKK